MILPDSITLARLEVDDQTCTAALAVLAPEEVKRIATFRNGERRRSFAVGRLAARNLLAVSLGIPAADVPLEVREDGSVGLPGDTRHVSISHSGSSVLAAVSAHPVGVDVEQVRVRPTALFRFILDQSELSIVERLPGSNDERIAVLWSIKESVLKGRRTGLRHSPKSLRLTFDLENRKVPGGPADVSVATSDGSVWICRFVIEDGVALAVSWPTMPV